MKLATAVSHQSDPELAAKELRQQFAGKSLSQILFFCSAKYDLNRLGEAINAELADYAVCGCTTAGEITPDGYSQGSITAIGFDSEDFAVSVGFVEHMEEFPLKEAQALVDQLRDECASANIAPLKEHSFAITLVDGLSIDEEIFLVTLNAALGSIPNFGGSAGDDINLARTHVFFNGRFHTNAAIVLLVNTPYEFEVFSTHHLTPSDTKLIVTEANQQERSVVELNAEPAARVYQDAVGFSFSANCFHQFALHPLAVKLGDDYFVRSIQSIEPDDSLKFFCAVEKGIVLTVMKSDDLLDNIQNQYDRLTARLGEPQLIIGFDCFLRRMEAQELGVENQVSELFKSLHVIGLNTYGEQYQGMHINQTLTGVAIGQRKHSDLQP